MIVFGWNHFNIKSFTSAEIGFSDSENSGIVIERRQKYFHLFWIPFFGIGKMWAVRKAGDSKLYDAPAAITYQIMKEKIEVKTPWYTYIGPIILVVIGLMFFISNAYEHYVWEKRSEAKFENEIQTKLSMIAKPTDFDYYVFENIKGSYSYDKVYLKVAKFHQDQITFYTDHAKIEGYSLEPVQVAQSFKLDKEERDAITINKNDLQKSFSQDYEGRYNFKGLQLFADNENYVLKEVFRVDGPKLTRGGSSSFRSNEITLGLVNKGFYATVTEVEPIEGSIEWKLSEPIMAQPGQRFMLKGSGNAYTPYKFRVACLDEEGKSYQFIVSGKGLNYEIERKI